MTFPLPENGSSWGFNVSEVRVGGYIHTGAHR